MIARLRYADRRSAGRCTMSGCREHWQSLARCSLARRAGRRCRIDSLGNIWLAMVARVLWHRAAAMGRRSAYPCGYSNLARFLRALCSRRLRHACANLSNQSADRDRSLPVRPQSDVSRRVGRRRRSGPALGGNQASHHARWRSMFSSLLMRSRRCGAATAHNSTHTVRMSGAGCPVSRPTPIETPLFTAGGFGHS